MAISNIEILKTMQEGGNPLIKKALSNIDILDKEIVLKTLINNQDLRNLFISNLVDTVVKPSFVKKKFENQLSYMYKGLNNASGIESISYNILQSKKSLNKSDLFNALIPDLNTCTQSINVECNFDYKLSILQLKNAFIDDYGLSSLLSQIKLSMENSIEIEEYKIIESGILKALQLTLNYEKKGKTNNFKILDSMANNNESVREIIYTIEKMKLKSKYYNSIGIENFTPKNNIILVIDSYFYSVLKSYQSTFSKTDLINNLGIKDIVVIDNFPQYYRKKQPFIDNGTLPGSDNDLDKTIPLSINYCLIDMNLISLYDSIRTINTFFNANDLTTSVFFNRYSILSTLLFENCIPVFYK